MPISNMKRPSERLSFDEILGSTEDLIFSGENDDNDQVPEPPRVSFAEFRQTVQKATQDALGQMGDYRLAPKARQILEEFIMFHRQVDYWKQDVPEVYATYYNLLVRSDSLEPVETLFGALRDALKIPTRATRTMTEAQLLERYSRVATELERGYTRMLFIHSCNVPPQVNNSAGTSKAINDALENKERYETTWRNLFRLLQKSPKTILIVHAPDAVYRTDLRRNTELFYRVCSNHVFIPPVQQEDLWVYCQRKLAESSFRMEDGFQESLKAYMDEVYERAELKGYAFVDDLLRRVYALHFSKPREEQLLTKDCIPLAKTQVITPEAVLGQMNGLVGLQKVKNQFRDIYKVQLLGLNEDKTPRYHMVFAGNPGTGKTTVAQMAADLFYRMGIIKTNRLVTTKASDFISQWIGGTAIKAQDTIQQAYDGVLFIDEAYGMMDNSHGTEAVNILIQEMEAKADRLIVILAGYKEQMRGFMDLNPGISSRIGRVIDFEDYSLEELVEIFKHRCLREGFSLEPQAVPNLENCIEAQRANEYFGNAREIENILQRLKEAWSDETYSLVSEQGVEANSIPKVFAPRHFDKIMPSRDSHGIDELIGLENLKASLRQFKQQVAYQKHLREKNMQAFPAFYMHMLFTGNPGTGKTTVAQRLADELYAIGVLKNNRLTVAGRQELIAVHVGETAPKAQKVVRQAAGGVLFIDEAYSLIPRGENDHSAEAVEVLLTAMEEHKSDTVFIFAGYDREMEAFLDTNPGLRSRIGYTFHFDDYDADELVEIFNKSVDAAGMVITPEALEKVRGIMEYFRHAPDFGNGRFVAKVFQQVIFRRAGRDYTSQYRDITVEDIPDIKSVIETVSDKQRFFDPGKITPEMQWRTAVHEVGHALAYYLSNPASPPKLISIENVAGSFGRMQIEGWSEQMSETMLFGDIVTCLGGLCAEKHILGDHTVGCASDVARAKSVSQRMLSAYAMDTYGNTPEQILATAREKAEQLVAENADRIKKIARVVVEKKIITTPEFLELMKD